MDKIGCREAFESGKTRYFTGEPCKHGHIAERMVSNGVCVDCLNVRRQKNRGEAYERTKAWRLAHPGARAEESRRWRERHPELAKEIKQRHRAKNIDRIRELDRETRKTMRQKYPEKEKERLSRYRARQEQKRVEVAGRQRPNVCDVCREQNSIGICFDHCHITGCFRGWLCDRCNKVLGMVKDSPILLMELSAYLKGNRNGQIECGAQECASRL
jgi:hypothetical protein